MDRREAHRVLKRAFLPELFYRDGGFEAGRAVVVDGNGAVSVEDAWLHPDGVPLPGRALLPGLVNAHSHAFQRVFRGATEARAQTTENFWSWREAMYRAANALSPEELLAVARVAFLEMALNGITTVGEFHYIHRDPSGASYQDPNRISKLMIQAAREVGVRICLLRVAYLRAGFGKPANPLQRRFIEANLIEANLETSADQFIGNVERLRAATDGRFSWVGVAPHSIRAVPLKPLREIVQWARHARVPVHLHAAEQPAELEECRAEYGVTPIALLAREGLLHDGFTAVHGIHVTHAEMRALAETRSIVCACPTTERNLGDGIVPAVDLLGAGVRIALGSDSQAQIDLLEDARELEYGERLRRLRRGLIDPRELFASATAHGAASLGAPCDQADFFTVDLRDISLAGSAREHLLSAIVFGASRTAVRDVVVGGEFIVRDGRHALQDEIVNAFLSARSGSR